MTKLFKFILTGIILTALSAPAQDKYIEIGKTTAHIIPVTMTGFSGEAESVLKFDLSVVGIVVQEPGDYTISGRSDGRVEGALTPAGSSRPIFSRAYAGGSTRSQAHALANDIAKELRSTAPIFQTRIAFRVKRGADMEVAIADYDGYNPVVLTHDGVLVDSPTWMPGNRGLMYASWMNNHTQFYLHDLTTGARRIFGGYPGSSFNARVSPDGQHVAMILSKNGSPNLYVSDIDGGNLRQLTRTRDEDSCPCWSPDSREICFVCRSGRAMLQKISVDGGSAVRMSIGGGAYGNLTAPDWSPDGKTIAFTTGSRPFHIWVVPAEGGEAISETEGEDPCWAPNSRTVIFTQHSGNQQVLSLLDVPTKHVKYLRQILGNCSEPSWAR